MTDHPTHHPTHHRTTTVHGLEVFHREAGPPDAPVVLLLHGFPTSSRMYRALIPLLSDRYRVIAPDLVGFGGSARPDRDAWTYTFDTATDVVEGLLDRLGVTTFVPYLMDFGGSIGWRLAVRRPDAIRGLVLQNAPLYAPDPSGFADLIPYWHDPSEATRAAVRRSSLSLEATRDQYLAGVPDPTLVDPDAWATDQAQLDRPGVDAIMLDYLLDISRQEETFARAVAFLRERQPPTLIATGANDPIFPGAGMRRFLDDLPGAELHLLDTGHFALETHAAEIGALMRTFLAQLSTAPPSTSATVPVT
jgi:pimeloyl-ACP methyl ester carboxylesterase